MTTNSRAIAKLKRNSRKWPTELGLSGLKNWLLQKLPACFVFWLLKNFLVKSDYKLKRESVKFFRYSNVAYGANRRSSCERMLVIAFGLIDQEFDADYVAVIRNAVRSTLNDSKNRFKHSENILACTRRIEIKKLDATGWYQLSRGLFSMGYFRAAWVARENSLDLSISEAVFSDSSSTSLTRGLQAYLERMKLVESKSILIDRGDQFSEKQLPKFRTFVGLFERGYKRSQNVGVLDIEKMRLFTSNSSKINLSRSLGQVRLTVIMVPRLMASTL